MKEAIETVKIVIETVGRRGDGVGTFEGMPVFVPRALPGELVRVTLGAVRDRGRAGRLLEVLEASPERVGPPCPYYDSCGGCGMQHWDLPSYRRWKIERVKTVLDRAGMEPVEWKEPVFIPEGTRRRATLAAFLQNKTLRLGYHRARSHDIADIPHCLILSPRLQKLTETMRPFLAEILTDSRPADVFVQDTGLAVDVMITGLTGSRKEPQMKQREAMADMARKCGVTRLSWRLRERDEPEIIVRHGPVIKRSGALSVDLPPGAFMQPSAEGEAALVEAVLEPLRKADARKTVDLFAGCGTFTGPLQALGAVYAVEGDEAPVAALRKAGVSAEQRDLFENPLGAKELSRFDAALLDPPRAGAAGQAAQMAQSGIGTVVYVSCNPSTFARDAALLTEGGYALSSVQIIDQFVWSAHIEVVGVFGRK